MKIYLVKKIFNTMIEFLLTSLVSRWLFIACRLQNKYIYITILRRGKNCLTFIHSCSRIVKEKNKENLYWILFQIIVYILLFLVLLLTSYKYLLLSSSSSFFLLRISSFEAIYSA